MDFSSVVISLFLALFLCVGLSFGEKTKKRTIARMVAIVIIIFLGILYYFIGDSFKRLMACDIHTQTFYNKRNTLCFGTIDVYDSLQNSHGIEVHGFVISNSQVALINDQSGFLFSVEYDPYENGYFKLVKLK